MHRARWVMGIINTAIARIRVATLSTDVQSCFIKMVYFSQGWWEWL